MTYCAPNTEALRPQDAPLDRSFLAWIFGRAPRTGETGPGADGTWSLAPYARDEASAAALAKGDRRKVGRGNPYTASSDIEALYALARAAGGAIALDLRDDREADSRRHRTGAVAIAEAPATVSGR